ncbi:PHA01755 superfamily protein [Candidatus Mancarchaeum acidiphilum]|uniref:PHA01755 superfamily protein n=1 Tax=Candidatus Mancarchaeum acidiphilum TaxID=1920749 RepID=A0A218NM42_9ARCH|nr:hypothetical protein [Candidatus Mancarchaeum acidiphilum]ASI13528.1 PHA01755 superfamily protein [Candidatus Mancarchaeum acidiphilum]
MLSKQLKSQSAVEFLSTYGFVILIIGIVISLLFAYISLPKSIIPSQCDFYNGFDCLSSGYSVNYSTKIGSVFTLIASDTEPGSVKITNFSVKIGTYNSNYGFCTPNVSEGGQKIYCYAYFNNFTPVIGNQYDGLFVLKSDYCSAPPQNLSDVNCLSKPANFTFDGSFRVQAADLNYSYDPYYANISITNSGGKIPAGYQANITIDPASFRSAETQNLGNIRFYYNGKELYSWCQDNCSSSFSQATFWVKLPVSLYSDESIPITMEFLPKTANYSGDYSGEAPQLSLPYAGYDNGDKVFDFYSDFNGVVLNNAKWNTTPDAIYTVDNGLTFSSAGSGYIESLPKFNSYTEKEAYVYPKSDTWENFTEKGNYYFNYSEGPIFIYPSGSSGKMLYILVRNIPPSGIAPNIGIGSLEKQPT